MHHYIKKLITPFSIATLLAIMPTTLLAAETTTCLDNMVTIKQDLKKMSEITDDYQFILQHTYPSLIERSGGEEKYIEILKRTIATFKDEKVNLTLESVEKPIKDILLSDKEICIIPMQMKIIATEFKVQSDGYMVAIRDFKTNTWKYLNGQPAAKHHAFKLLIPNLPDDFTFPDVKTVPIN